MNGLDLFNFVGTLASLTGLWIAVVQIFKVKNIAEATKDSSEKTRMRVVELLFAMDVPKALKVVSEIQLYNRNKNYNSSILRMHDLKEYLAQIKNNGSFSDFIDIKKCGKYITVISVGIADIEKEIHNTDGVLDILKLNKSLEEMFSFLSDIDTTVKREGVKYDY